MKKVICMIGPNKELKGGIATVINQYSKSYLIEKYNIEFISSYSNSHKIIEFFKGLLQYIKLRKMKDIDIVHIHVASKGSFFRKSIFVLFTPKKLPIVLHIHGGGFFKFYNNSNILIKKIIKRVFNRANRIIVISDKFKNQFIRQLELPECKVIKIYNGINIIEKKIDMYNKKNQVLYMGKLTDSKGIYDFLESIPKVHEQLSKITFIIAGNGDVEKINKIITSNDMNNYVRVVGWISGEEKEKYLLESSILVVPSHFEAFGISIIEAMQYGLSIVATNVGGIPEIVKLDINGKLVEKGDIFKLTEYIIFYAKNTEIRIKTGENNMNRCLEFDISNTIRQTENLYKEISEDG